MDGEQRPRDNRASMARTATMLACGVAATLVLWPLRGWVFALIGGWGVCCAVYVVWVWIVIGRADEERTRELASRQDPARTTSDALLLVAAVASLVALVVVSIQSKSGGVDKGLAAGVGFASVLVSWIFIHTLYTLRYAALYYSDASGPIDFHQKTPPRYWDFAYVAFTIGATFQVSDTNLKSSAVRAVALRHALLSYLFGAVILAGAVNVVSSLA
jgi:uncharacterized membrane protein